MSVRACRSIPPATAAPAAAAAAACATLNATAPLPLTAGEAAASFFTNTLGAPLPAATEAANGHALSQAEWMTDIVVAADRKGHAIEYAAQYNKVRAGRGTAPPAACLPNRTSRASGRRAQLAAHQRRPHAPAV